MAQTQKIINIAVIAHVDAGKSTLVDAFLNQSGVFRDNEELLREIRDTIVRAVRKEYTPKPPEFPCVMEKSFKRVEDAAAYRERLCACGIPAEHPEDEILGRDAHTVRATVRDMDAFITCI